MKKILLAILLLAATTAHAQITDTSSNELANCTGCAVVTNNSIQ